MKHLKLFFAFGLSMLIVGVLLSRNVRAQTAPIVHPFQPVPDQEHLVNGHFITAKVISGAQPEGEESFKALKALGVKTIISVDGAKPDVETARKYQMRYVHLPMTYATVTQAQGMALAKALQELPGPIYVHCHHGKHRSAAAVAVACVMNGMIPPADAEEVLDAFGTGKNYLGLWKAALEARPADPKALAEVKVEYHETQKIEAIPETMVKIDQRADDLKLLQANQWQPVPEHPDLDPAHEALQLEELLHEIPRTDAAITKYPEFQRLLNESEAATTELRLTLESKPLNPSAARAALIRVNASCTACHQAYRD